MIFVGLGIVLGGLVGLLTSSSRACRSPLPPVAARSDHGSGLRLAASRPPDLRSHPGVSHVDLRYRRSFRLHGLRGLGAGPSFFSGLQKSGLSLVFVGLICSFLPHTVGDPIRALRPKDEPADRLGAVPARARSPLRFARSRKRRRATARSRLHRAVCDRQYRADRLGTRPRRDDGAPDGPGAGARRLDPWSRVPWVRFAPAPRL